ncbi:MAG: PepSY domain-containing protein [Bacillota bacterium]|nr:PepSY domain-containing protein [Bacillota bacterium]
MKKFAKLSLLLSLLLVLVACNPDLVLQKTDPDSNQVSNGNIDGDLSDKEEDDKDQDIDTDDDLEMNQGLEAIETFLSIEEAAGAFYDNFGSKDIQIDEIQLSKDDQILAYKIQGFDENTEYEFKINAENGQILEEESEADEKSPDDFGIALDLIITPNQAMTAALIKTDGSFVKKWILKTEDRGVYYDLELNDDIEVTVNAETGEVIEADR